METSNKFILHHNNTSWGREMLIMEKEGKAFARAYWFNDEEGKVYLDWLSVNEECTRQGIGTKLQEIREQVGKDLGAITSHLWVKKDSWMYEWYKRRGYIEYYDHEEEPGNVWMKKIL